MASSPPDPVCRARSTGVACASECTARRRPETRRSRRLAGRDLSGHGSATCLELPLVTAGHWHRDGPDPSQTVTTSMTNLQSDPEIPNSRSPDSRFGRETGKGIPDSRFARNRESLSRFGGPGISWSAYNDRTDLLQRQGPKTWARHRGARSSPVRLTSGGPGLA